MKAHLEQFRERLEPRPDDWAGRPAAWPGRKPGSYQWYEIQDSVDYYPAFDEPKILWPDIAKLPRFSWDEDVCYANNTGYIMPCEPWLLGVIQSRVCWFCLSQVATPLRLRAGLWQYRCINQFMVRLPIPDVPEADREALAESAIAATAIARERYALHETVRHRIATDLDDGTHAINQKLATWYDLDFRGFRSEVKKAFATDIPLSERADWESALATWQSEHQALTTRLIAIETEIDDRVHALFAFTPAERQTLHAHMEKAMID